MIINMTIDGRRFSGERTFAVENPARAEVFAQAPACTLKQLDHAVGAAAAAHSPWAARPIEERRRYLRACGAALSERVDEVAALLTREQGKPLTKALAEARLSAEWFALTADLTLCPERLVDDAAAHIVMHRVPYGVVAAIAPSNYPIILSVCKIAPALLAGNTVVLKPSPDTPLASLLMVDLLASVLPPGVLNIVTGDGDLGRSLIRHPKIRKISFTGSVEIGKAIAREAAAELKRVTLELGGNDPAIVLEGADVASIAPRLFAGAMENSGQFCTAIKRIYVHRQQHAELVDALAAQADATRVGDGADPTTELGPLVNRRQLHRVAEFVDDAVRAGGRVVTGGRILDRPGYFYAPTVVTDLPAGTRLEQDEQFGPVIPVVAYDDITEAVGRANATPFGLGASVWGDEDEARDASAAVDAGTVWLNTHGDLRHNVPFGGLRLSGVGVEYGYWGLLEYTQTRVLNQARV